jgi:NitT/TauT family transport system permease protein
MTGFGKYRHLILPASMPSFISGLKQGWAFLLAVADGR